ncbi:hypothetical protein [Roseibium sp. TrichSKD4]|uniref:hypothetical protein n=1 Tax=Roseibium sp. TrichSKD4 TaxID=744980 RepID=UPI001AD8AB59|nr:hypothetical protein [Roseibium sp. TrichSKD4]
MADGSHSHAVHQDGAVQSERDAAKTAAFDILAAHAHRNGNVVTFHMTTNGIAGAEKPTQVGELAGAPAYAYVWPTTLDPSSVGFDEGAGILAMAAATHPDFDDTPLFDENGDGNVGNDGNTWHSHWVVLAPDEACGPGALTVKDIPEDAAPNLPATWPGLPILLDSPGFTPLFDGPEVSVNVAFDQSVNVSGINYDGVTAALRVNANIHAPLFCVTDVFDVASGDLSLPGKIQ